MSGTGKKGKIGLSTKLHRKPKDRGKTSEINQSFIIGMPNAQVVFRGNWMKLMSKRTSQLRRKMLQSNWERCLHGRLLGWMAIHRFPLKKINNSPQLWEDKP